MAKHTTPNKVEAVEYTEDEITEIQKDFFFEVLANTLVKDQPEACARYIEDYHGDDARLMLIASVLRGQQMPKSELPWSKLSLALHYQLLYEVKGHRYEDAIFKTAKEFNVEESAVSAALTAVRKYYGLTKGGHIPCVYFNDETPEK